MEESHSFVPLLIVVALAFFVPLVLTRFRRLRLPVVVGEILAGIVVGDSGLQLVGHDSMLDVLSLLGFAYLMFLSGLEIDFDVVVPRPGAWQGSWKERLGSPVVLGLVVFGLTLALALPAGWLLQTLGMSAGPWLMALILSTTSLGVVVPVLKERGILGTAYGQSLLVATVIADFLTMLLVSVYVIINTSGLTLELLLVLLLFGVFGSAYRLARAARRRFPGLGLFRNVSAATAQIDVRGAFAIGLFFIALAQGLGVEMILGAFLGGALISLLADRHATDLHHRLDVIGYAFFIPIFFIMVGVRFDLGAVLASPQSLLLVPMLLLLAYLVKLVAAAPFRISYGGRDTLAGGILLTSHLSLEIAVAAIGLQLGIFDQATNSAIILMAVITCTVSPLIFNRVGPMPTEAPRKFVVVGAGRTAQLLARRLSGHGKEVVVLDGKQEGLEVAGDAALPLAEGDARDLTTWQALEPETIRAVAVMLPDDGENLEVVELARERLGLEPVAALIHDAALARRFADLGAQVVNASLSPIVEMEYLLLYPTISSVLTDLEDDYDVAEVTLRCRDLVDRPLSELNLPGGVRIVIVRREGDVVLPQGHTRLRMGDVLTLMGSQDAVGDMVERCHRERA